MSTVQQQQPKQGTAEGTQGSQQTVSQQPQTQHPGYFKPSSMLYGDPFSSSMMSPFYPSSSMFSPFSNVMQPFSGFGGGVFDVMRGGFEQPFWNMQRETDRALRQMERIFSSDLTYQPSRPASMLEHYYLTNPIRVDAQGNRWLNVYFDMRSYKPEEVNVILDSKNRCINVEANQEVKDKGSFIKRTYSRRVCLPEDLNVDLSKIDVKSCLTNEGLLCIEAALPKVSIEEGRKEGKAVSQITGGQPGVYPINVKTI